MSVLDAVRRPHLPGLSRSSGTAWTSRVRRVLPTGLDVRLWAAAAQFEIKRRWKDAKRRIYPGAPSLGMLIVCAIGGAALVVALFLAIDLIFGWNVVPHSDKVCTDGEVPCALVTHVIGTGIVVLLGYFLWFLRRETRAAAKWRKEARESPEKLMDWVSPWGGLTALAALESVGAEDRDAQRSRLDDHHRSPSRSLVDSTVLRTHLVEEIARELNEDAGPQIIVGDTGSGKTMLLLELCRYLAKHGQVPVPLTLRGAESIDFAEDGQDAYLRSAKAKDDEEAKKQWAWLKERQLITILADDLEQSETSLDTRLSALARASRSGLRLIVATRPYGLPHPNSHRREQSIGGRVDLPELEPAELRHDLGRWAEAAGKQELEPKIAEVVDKVKMGSTPYYLALARVLIRIHAFDQVPTDGDVQLSLIHAYRKAFEAGRVTPDDGLTCETRAAVFDRLEPIAFFRLLDQDISTDALDGALDKLAFRSADTKLVDSPVDLAKRMGVLEDRHNHGIWFAQPTTLAYFAAEFLRKQPADGAHWNDALAQCRTDLSPLLMLCLKFASTATSRDATARAAYPTPADRTVGALCDRIAQANGRRDELAMVNLKLCAAAADIMRLKCLTSASEPHPSSDRDQLLRRVVETARSLTAVAGRLIVEKQSLVSAIGALGAQEALWESATASKQEYAVRREAMRQLLSDPVSAIDFLAPRVKCAIEAGKRQVENQGMSDDDEGQVFDELRAVAWILPSLCTKARGLRRTLDYSPKHLLKLARKLTVQLGLESSIAQGVKLDAMLNPDAPVDGFALKMLTAEGGRHRAQFWFTRILLLQAVTRRCFPSDGTRVADRDEVTQIVKATMRDETQHPFVRESARLCGLALQKGDWERFIWSDMTEIAAGSAHCLTVETTQLIGDIIIALNLNSRQDPTGREGFGMKSELPYCLSESRDRRELLGAASASSCPFATSTSSGGSTTATPGADSAVRCLCPYLYEPKEQELNARRELSRAFCRHQRITARPLRWAPDINSEHLREFWKGMEMRARF